MTDAASLRAPFRSPRLTGAQIGWMRPVLAVLAGLWVPAGMSMLVLYIEAPNLSGPPKDGSDFTAKDHVEMFMACLAASVVVSWMIAPIVFALLRISAMLGWAGWGSAILSALIIGLPAVHLALNGDVTTEDQTLLLHISLAIAFLGLSVWAVFWALIARACKSPNFLRT